MLMTVREPWWRTGWGVGRWGWEEAEEDGGVEDGELRVLRGPPDLQTNLITSPAEWNHFASFGMAHLPEKRVGREAGRRGRGL